MTLLEQALDAVRRGLKVFPCQPRTKIPLPGTNGAKELTDNVAQVRRWWAQNANYNIGTNAGVVVDIDSGVNSLEEALNVAKIWGLPPTLTIRTGRRSSYGVQFHFLGDGPQGGFDLNGCHGEVRCLKGNQYGMFAGSIHPDTGCAYEIVVDAPLALWPEACRLGSQRAGAGDYCLGTIASPEKMKNTRLVIENALQRAGIDFTFHNYASNKNFACRWQFVCPNVSEHTDHVNPYSDILMQKDGVLAFKCYHGHCGHMNWQWMRTHLEKSIGEKLKFNSTAFDRLTADEQQLLSQALGNEKFGQLWDGTLNGMARYEALRYCYMTLIELGADEGEVNRIMLCSHFTENLEVF